MVAAAAATSVLSLCSSHALADSGASSTTSDSPGVLAGNNVQVPVEVPVNLCGNSVNVLAGLNPVFGNTCVNESHSDDDGPHHDSHHGSHDGSYGGSHGSSDEGSYGGPGDTSGHGGDAGGYGDDTDGYGGASAEGSAVGSPGVGSGNLGQVPVDVPVNVCGNTVNVIGILNPAFGNHCESSGYGDTPPNKPPTTPPGPQPTEPPKTPPATPPGTSPHTPPVTPPDQVVPHSPSTGGSHVPPQLADTGGDSVLGAAAASAALVLGGAILYRRSRVASHR
jgi:hypothetical protein